MSKTMWVVKRYDGRYFNHDFAEYWRPSILDAALYFSPDRTLGEGETWQSVTVTIREKKGRKGK